MKSVWNASRALLLFEIWSRRLNEGFNFSKDSVQAQQQKI